jgi:hypothetical protein
MSRPNTYTNFPQTVKAVGVRYSKVMYAVLVHRIVVPKTVGCSRLFTPAQVQTLRQHFAQQANNSTTSTSATTNA